MSGKTTFESESSNTRTGSRCFENLGSPSQKKNLINRLYTLPSNRNGNISCTEVFFSWKADPKPYAIPIEIPITPIPPNPSKT